MLISLHLLLTVGLIFEILLYSQEFIYKFENFLRMSKHSTNLIESVRFYLHCYRKLKLTFAGIAVPVVQDIHEASAIEVFKAYENGSKSLITKHSNVLQAIIIGKKSWALHLDMWSNSIAEGTLFKFELLEYFQSCGVIIPAKFMQEFNNAVVIKRNKIKTI